MRILSILFSTGLLFSSLHAATGDPEDDTFNPSNKETIANGSSRIGDPSPFREDGFDTVGYTHLVAKGEKKSGVPVRVSFLVPFVPGYMEKPGGATMFLLVESDPE